MSAEKKEFDNEMRGTLWQETERKSEKSPAATGTVTISGLELRIAMWPVRVAGDGNDDLASLFEKYAQMWRLRARERRVYCLTNFNTTMEWNLHRIYTLRDLGYDPFVMVYDKPNAPKDILRLQR